MVLASGPFRDKQDPSCFSIRRSLILRILAFFLPDPSMSMVQRYLQFSLTRNYNAYCNCNVCISNGSRNVSKLRPRRQ